ncbi:MAG: sulfotransferase [Chloroflexi bacterium]|nr:sulfotransferase [Chloroflexota bacterium]
MNLPTFIIAGAPRCGTSYLYEMCAAHPEVYMARPRVPEPKFFLVDEEYKKGLDYYTKKYYAAAQGYKAVGEKSTYYLEDPRVAERIHSNMPDIRLVFILRNPVERTFSNYLWSRKNGIETLSFEEALLRESEREASYEPRFRYVRPFSYMSRGMYARLLAPYFARFRRSQILVLFFDELTTAPETLAHTLFRFLGVTPRSQLAFEFGQKINSARRPQDTTPPLAAAFLHGVFFRPNQELAALLGQDLSHWNRFDISHYETPGAVPHPHA